LQRCEETNLVLNWEKCHFMVNEGIVFGHKISERGCRGFVNRSAIGVGVWRFVEGGEHGRAIRDDGSTSLPSF
jgi:hypothetical protein